VTPVALARFVMSGGGAYCMSLRRDRASLAVGAEPAPAREAATA